MAAVRGRHVRQSGGHVACQCGREHDFRYFYSDLARLQNLATSTFHTEEDWRVECVFSGVVVSAIA